MSAESLRRHLDNEHGMSDDKAQKIVESGYSNGLRGWHEDQHATRKLDDLTHSHSYL